MAIKSEPYYWLECDECGAKSTEADEFSAWADEWQAAEMADCSDWLTSGDRHYCDECRIGQEGGAEDGESGGN